MPILPSLNGIRAICILFVLGAHCAVSDGFPAEWQTASHFIVSGKLGVTVFFVLSGFLITYLLSNEELQTGGISLTGFYARRCLRILPVYYAFILAVAILESFTPIALTASQYLSSVTFTKNIFARSWIDGHLWSLAVEEQFYLLWPFLVSRLGIRGRLIVALAMVLAAPAFRVGFYVTGHGYHAVYSFPANMDSLMIGSVAGMWVSRRPVEAVMLFTWHPLAVRLVALMSIYVVWVLNATLTGGKFTVPFGATVQASAAAYLIGSYAIHRHGFGYWLLNLPVMNQLGILSFSIYIWQQPFFTKAEEFGESRVWILTFPFNVVSAVAIATVSYYTLERPLLKLRKRFRRGRVESNNSQTVTQ